MADDFAEKIERLCERFGIPEPWRSSALRYFEDGRERYGPWNHLAMSDAELADQTVCEASDLLSFILFFPWSRTYHSTLIEGQPIPLNEEAADEAVDPTLVDALTDFLRLLSGGENGRPAHER